MKTLVTIATFERPDTATFLKDKLMDEHIDCYFLHMGKAEDHTLMVKVQVEAEDVERAIGIMMKIRVDYGRDIEAIKHERLVRKILVPTDFSSGSEVACHYALHMARQMKAEIKLVHIFENPVGALKLQSNATFETYLAQVEKEVEKNAREGMLSFVDRVRRYMEEKEIGDVIVQSVMARGRVLPAIQSVCESYQPEIIVLGTEGQEQDEPGVFSGITRELVSELGIPILAIPAPRPFTDFEKLRILYATDFNEKDHTSLNRLLRIMEPFRKDITCVHIDTAHNPAKEDRIDELNGFLRKEYPEESITCSLIDYANVADGLKEFAKSNSMNMLSFTIHKRGIFEMLFMPNLFRKILKEANIPMLVFPS